MTLEGVQEAYDEALRRVLRDLPRDLVRAIISVDFAAPDGLAYRFTSTDGSAHLAPLVPTSDVEVATQLLADQVQDDVLTELWSASWPQCPWHDHPPMARVVDGEAVWVCARSGYLVARIGEANQRRRRPPGRGNRSPPQSVNCG